MFNTDANAKAFMRTSRIKHPVITLLTVATALGVGTITPAFAQVDAAASEPVVGLQAHTSFSPGIRDVLKMVDAKVDPEVIKSYIKNSSAAYNPTAAEIIDLK